MNYLEKDFEAHIETQLHRNGYTSSQAKDYDKTLCLIPSTLINFIKKTQAKPFQALERQYGADTAVKLMQRIASEIETRGVIDVLRQGVKDRGTHFQVVYFQPKSGLNPEHQELYQNNQFSTVRQLKYSQQNQNSIDMGLFINGIPIIMLELKNTLTGQNHTHAIKQWKTDRDPKEPLFIFKRNLVYFAVGNEKCAMATHLRGSKTRFLPFNKSIDNPVNPKGHKTHYLWEDILQPPSILDLIENFVHIAINKDKVYDAKQKKVVEKTTEVLIFPRFHQLNVIRKLKQDVITKGTGHHYLIQHTTGSGKSLSIGWLSHLLSSLYQNNTATHKIFDSIIVITDRRILDKQIRNTIRQLEHTKGVVNAVEETSQQLKEFIESGKTIIISTIQKFPVISHTIAHLKNKTFGIIIDEVHSSQSGETAKHLKKSLSKAVLETYKEDITEVDQKLLEEISARGQQLHISYFGFSGTPKNKTLEIFGTKTDNGSFKAFDLYSMKQSIAEGFTLDVLQNYTSYQRYFKINKTIKHDKKVPESKVKSMLMHWVDLHSHTITEKTHIILDHFINHTAHKLKGKSRAMLVTRSRLHCVKYKLECDKQMKAKGLPYRALVGFSGKVTDAETLQDYTESSMNGFSDQYTEEKLKEPKYRLLIVNNKFQTGFDEPMLHTMYVDKTFGGLQCVQTLSRLNRTMSGKTDTFVLDFVNNPQEIQEAFQPYFEGAVLTEETDPNRLYQIEQKIKTFNLFQEDKVSQYVKTFYDDAIPLEALQSILDSVVAQWQKLEDVEQDAFKHNIQSFIRLYAYISQIIAFKDINLEQLFIFLRGLNKKLPKRDTDKLSDILSAVDLEYFKIEKKHTHDIELEEKEGIFQGIKESANAYVHEKPIDFFSQIIQTLNALHQGTFDDTDKVRIEHIQNKISDNNVLKKVMNGDNSEMNKRDMFNRTCDDLLVDMVDAHIDFYNKMSIPHVQLMKEQLYNLYSAPALLENGHIS